LTVEKDIENQDLLTTILTKKDDSLEKAFKSDDSLCFVDTDFNSVFKD
jgi:hypothetical protein